MPFLARFGGSKIFMLEAFRHIVHAAGYSMAGLGYLLRSELAARIEAGVIVLAFVWFALLGRSVIDFLGLAVIACMLMSVEALNTAIEDIVDKLSPEQSGFARGAKDLGSTAVFFMLTAGGLYVLANTADAFGLIFY
jgi:diacylglycerol kinase (ATP)